MQADLPLESTWVWASRPQALDIVSYTKPNGAKDVTYTMVLVIPADQTVY